MVVAGGEVTGCEPFADVAPRQAPIVWKTWTTTGSDVLAADEALPLNFTVRLCGPFERARVTNVACPLVTVARPSAATPS